MNGGVLQRPLVLPQVPFCINKVRVAEAGLGLADVPSLPNCIAALHGREVS